MRNYDTKILKLDDREQAIKEVLEILKNQNVLALPTETVYGLAGNAASDEAVAAIYRIKNRPTFNPLIAHVSDIDMVENYCILDPLSRSLIKKFWPGPLSLVLPLKKEAKISSLAKAGLETIAVRCPKGIFREIVAAFGAPLVAPSANKSGQLSPTTAQAVYDDLSGLLPLIIDSGPCHIGVESTIIKIAADDVFLLRAGGLDREVIEKFIGKMLKIVSVASSVEVPGQLLSHYAPKAKVRLNAQDVKNTEALLAFGPQNSDITKKAVYCLNLSSTGDLSEAARYLFCYLKALDKFGVETIAVQPIPDIGLGEAINDRLKRAAAPR